MDVLLAVCMSDFVLLFRFCVFFCICVSACLYAVNCCFCCRRRPYTPSNRPEKHKHINYCLGANKLSGKFAGVSQCRE